MTTMTLTSIIILIMLLGTIAIFMIVTHFWKCRNEYTLPNESGRTKSLLWSYANEVADGTIECNNVHEESPKTCINREYEEPGHTEPNLTDVRPVYSQINRLEDRPILARRTMSSLVSIAPNEKEKVYFGETLKTTVISTGYNYLILILSIVNIVMFLLMRVAKAYYEKGLHVDIFSPVSMYSLATSYYTGETQLNRPPEKDIVIEEERSQDELEEFPTAQEFVWNSDV